jgi:iron(III) transport system permease protein
MLRNSLGVFWCLVVLCPLAVLFGLWPDPELIRHLLQHVLPSTLWTTFLLLVGVLLLSGLLGLSLAYISVFVGLPGPASMWTFLFVMPLAMPSYVLALGWVMWLDWGGPLNPILGQGFAIRSLPGLIVVMSLSLYPYVYIWAKARFRQVHAHFELASTLGLGFVRRWTQVLLPLSLRAVLGALLLVGLETLADMGAAMVLGQNTWSVSIYRSWHGLQSLEGAAFLSLGLVVLGVFAFGLLPRSVPQSSHSLPSRPASRTGRWMGTIWAIGVVGVSLVLPVVALLWMAPASTLTKGDLWMSVGHSLSLAALVATLTVSLVVLLRWTQGPRAPHWMRLARLGYAIPGSVLAVGVYGLGSQSLMMSGWVVLALGLTIRFFAVGAEPLEDAMGRVSNRYGEAAQVLGANSWGRFRRLWAPLLGPSAMMAWLVVALDTLKELPLSLMLKAPGDSLLSVVVAEWASEGRFFEASFAALFLVGSGALLALIFARLGDQDFYGSART